MCSSHKSRFYGNPSLYQCPRAATALDNWERLREASAAVLLRLPTPLPGLGSPAALQPLLARALRLLACPRGREADAGAQLLLLLLRKYGGAGARAGSSGGCCWQLDVAAGTVAAAPPAAEEPDPQAAALWRLLASACDLLQQRLRLADQDMLEACRGGLVQGVLLALRWVPGDVRRAGGGQGHDLVD